ncbi:hypothetical protein C2S52_010813 [Perilla frutescens var. hirtella]|nr:hypothetical protein C2S52_010813 [Perilla frutescens var. hirtella]KAH6817626.1 hypothetical protein C2S51_001229 [Perilla frutescens var. frutescens]
MRYRSENVKCIFGMEWFNLKSCSRICYHSWTATPQIIMSVSLRSVLEKLLRHQFLSFNLKNIDEDEELQRALAVSMENFKEIDEGDLKEGNEANVEEKVKD